MSALPPRRLEIGIRLEPVGAVRRVGLLLLSTDLTTERDAAGIYGPEGIATHVSRVAFENPTTPENLAKMAPLISAAADLLPRDTPMAAILFGCTSGTVEIGPEAVRAAVHLARPGVPVVTPPTAALAAFAALGVRRLALLTPYLEETTRPMAAWFAAAGLELVSVACLGMGNDEEMARVAAGSILEAAEAADHPEAEALFVSCTALPAFAAAAAIEARLGKPVITSNQAALWQLRGLAGRDVPAEGFGALLARLAPGAAA